MTTEIINQNHSMDMVMDADLSKVTQQLQAISNFQTVVQENLKSGQDFGLIPGTNKPTLLKPGAEKIQMLFGVTSEYEEIERIQDYDNGFFAYTIKCTLSKNGQKITEGMGHCNTKEKKYIKQDPFTLANTCLKMAKKRAQIDATLTIASLSEVFTQDMEDLQEFVQREQTETMNEQDARLMKVTFGKHKGRTLGDIVQEDASYVEWLAKNAKQEAMKQAANMLLGKSKGQQNAVPLITKEQIDEVYSLADIIAKANNLSREEVIKAYGINELEKINQMKAKEFIERLGNKVSSLMPESVEKQEELFDDSNPPFEGTEIDISNDDLPF
ncbi:hypothetical protein CYR81_11230 [Enterococcus faecalis]|uniref:exodeoxyribonuclease X C-terminal domain-containing protein n=1 Tax=Enterococcus TaxID=1350 RepID=UPI0003644AF0|nr:hypothetical protein [Enterococcus faecalis]EGO2729429.1 hypothetical protein [Enterococcus faecalis]EGO7662696.1 hypothetical protein [Enterococcus faecalis]EHE8185429.1 hypothetical protein [Enterococcus faecalis]EMC0712023.1 hypothetical protein [Enterococcus faecalis]EPI30602.1 hypothetical protein D350_01249 [Enterococcus faecalis VC1B-1]